MSENTENKELQENTNKIPDEETNDAVGGYGSGSGFFMTVGNCFGSYLALRPEPYWDQYHELYQLLPGYQVFTYGATANGTGLNGTPCTYRYVQYDGIWGWANASFLY